MHPRRTAVLPICALKHCLVRAAFIAGLTGTLFSQAAGPGCSASRYKIIPLPLHPVRISRAGVIVGTTAEHKLATWSRKDGLHEIELPAGFTAAEPLAINPAGDFVGSATREGSSQPVAFRYSHGKFFTFAGSNSKASAINATGDAAGESAGHLVVWRNQEAVSLGECCGGAVHAMNQQTEIVGEARNKEGRFDAFLWDPAHGMQSIAPAASTSSAALAINHQGHVLIQSFSPNNVFLRKAGKLFPVQLSADVASQPLALNNCDVIAGEFGAASDFYRGFVWDPKRGFRDLNGLIDASDWTLDSAVDINDRGQIIGTGDHGDEEDTGFLLVPDQPTSSTKATKGHKGN